MTIQIRQFLKPWNSKTNILENVKNFTSNLGWYPNEAIIENDKSTFIEGHVFVEHGLDNTAVISFLNENKLLSELKNSEKRKILSVSYNNLTKIHYIIDRHELNCFNNLDKNEDVIFSKKLEDINLQTIISEELYKTNISQSTYKALDEAFIYTIKKWQERLYIEFGENLNNDIIANIFNIIIFLRAIEDHKKNLKSNKNLLNIIEDNNINSIEELINNTLSYHNIKINSLFINIDEIRIIDNLIKIWLIKKILSDFYESDYAPYTFNFAIMSKHSLSRIYEQFVKIFTSSYNQQLTLFGLQTQGKLVSPEKSGIFYTPEFIARFFARYSKELIDIDIYNSSNTTILEPAVGSGIFIRTFLEYQLAGVKNKEVIDNLFSSIQAFDNNEIACKATQLSLTLLYLSLTGDLPNFKLNITKTDTLDWYLYENTRKRFNLVISNPPFISYHDSPENIRNKVKGVLNDTALGFPDLYFAFIKIAIESLKENGVGMFVLPHTFLTSKSAGKLRNYLGQNSKIIAIVDLSSTTAFETADVYTILLIFQKLKNQGKNQNVSIVKAETSVGEALTLFLENKQEENEAFSVYKTDLQITEAPWYLHTPAHRIILNVLNQHEKLSKYFDVRTGVTAGNKNVFIQNLNTMVVQENALWVPFAADKDLKAYQILNKKESNQFFFYPYVNNTLITENELRERFPLTYKFLLKHKSDLQSRAEFNKNQKSWFSPNRPRKPDFMMVPKILMPHLCIIPKFSFDINGDFAIARAPFICLKQDIEDGIINDSDLFFYLLGILHSRLAFWYISQHSDSYSAGYLMLERASLDNLPIPSPSSIPHEDLLRFIDLVKQRSGAPIEMQPKFDKIIDEEVFYFYGLSIHDKHLFNNL